MYQYRYIKVDIHVHYLSNHTELYGLPKNDAKRFCFGQFFMQNMIFSRMKLTGNCISYNKVHINMQDIHFTR